MATETKQGWVKYIAQIITVLILLGGMIGGYATNAAQIEQNAKDVAKVESVQTKHAEKIEEIKLKAVGDSSDIKHIKETVDKMAEKLEELVTQ